MGAHNSRGGAPPGGVFGACCSSPANDAEKIYPTPLDGAPRMHGRHGAGNAEHVSGMRLLLEAEEKSKLILLDAKQKRMDTLGQARRDATEESIHFEGSYRREIAKHEAQLAKEISKYETTIVTQNEKELNKELSHASKRHEAVVSFLSAHTMNVRLELTVNAQELIQEQVKNRQQLLTKHETSSTTSSSKKSSRRVTGPAPESSPSSCATVESNTQFGETVVDKLKSTRHDQQAMNTIWDTSIGSAPSGTRHHNTPPQAAVHG